MAKKRKILGVTGIRSEYDILSSVFRAVADRSDLELELIVTGAHLSSRYGNTVEMIWNDGFKIADTIESLIDGNRNASRLKGLAVQLSGMVQTVDRVRPDFILVLGDREEPLTAATVGAYLNIPVAHISGGDRALGNVDDLIRHAVTKLSHLHFVTSQESYDRVIKLGEQPFRVFNTGNPGLDRLLNTEPLSATELSSRLGFMLEDGEPFVLLIQHVISTEVDSAHFQMQQTLEAVKTLGIKTVLSYPNSDAGSHEIIRAIQEYKDLPFLHVAKNIPRPEFVTLMRRAGCMLGNSSAGILEAPSLHLPVINVGNRQQGRLHAENVQFVPHEVGAICAAVKKALFDKAYRAQVARCSNPYGDGTASQQIAEVLATIPLTPEFLIKDIAY